MSERVRACSAVREGTAGLLVEEKPGEGDDDKPSGALENPPIQI